MAGRVEAVGSASGGKIAEVGVGPNPMTKLGRFPAFGSISKACDAVMLGRREGITIRFGRGEEGPAKGWGLRGEGAGESVVTEVGMGEASEGD